MSDFSLNVNNKLLNFSGDPNTPLLWVLRDSLHLYGTKYGCGISQCGACTIHLDGNPIRSCTFPVSAVQKSKITTIEGLSEKADHPLQKAWDELDVPQCGYCQSGQIMTAAALLANNKNPNDEDITIAMANNICRCGTYHRIHEAIKVASKKAK